MNFDKARKYAKVVSISVAVAAVGTASGKYLTDYLHDKDMKDSIRTEAAIMATCEIKGEETRGCFDPYQKVIALDSARKYEKVYDFREAGLIYAELGREDDALRLKNLCITLEKGCEAELVEAIYIKARAIETFVDAPKTEKTKAAEAKPDVSASASAEIAPKTPKPADSK